MRLKIPVLTVSLLCAMIIISGGYGYWQKDLTIKGNITVVRPDTKNEVQQPKQPNNKELNQDKQDQTIVNQVGTGTEKEKVEQSPEIIGSDAAGEQATIPSSLKDKDSKTSIDITIEAPLANNKSSNDKMEENK